MNLKIVLKISLLVMVLGLVSLTLHQTYADFINTMDNEGIQIEQMSDDLDLYISEVTEISKENESEESDETDTYEDVELEREQYPELELNDDQAVGNDILEEDVDPVEDEASENEDSVEAIEMSNDDVIPVFDQVGLIDAINNAPIDGTLRIVEVESDFDLTGVVNIPSDTNIMLRSDDVNENRTLTRTGSGRHIHINSDAVFTLGDGIILTSNGNNAGGVNVARDGEFVMEGGAISGNTVTGANAANSPASPGSDVTGVGVNVAAGGMFVMSGGEISGNIGVGGTGASNANFPGLVTAGPGGHVTGVGVNIAGGGEFVMKGGEISDNTGVGGNGGTANVNAGIAGNVIGVGVNVAEGGEFVMEDGEISGNTGDGGNGGNAVGTGTRGHGGNVSGVGVNVAAGGMFVMEGGEISDNTATGGRGGNGGNGVPSLPSSGGNGGSVTGVGLNVAGNAEFRMIGEEISGGKISLNRGSGGSGGTGPGGNGSVGSVTGGGVNVAGNAEFVMEVGIISQNKANHGGGVSVQTGGTFLMEDGVIHDNEATTHNGGGVRTNGMFTMQGGIILENTATSNGGGVSVQTGGTFLMEDGTIHDNEATLNGGGVSVPSNTEFRVIDGEIMDNTARHGGGVRVNGGIFTMEGGQISYNIASGDGGGISLLGANTSVDLTGSDIKIFENESGGFGGGIAADNVSNVPLNNIQLFDNEAQYGGGFAGISNNTNAELTGVRIHNNTAFNRGGGIYLAAINEVKLYGTVIESNDAVVSAGGMYVGGNIGELVIDGGEITLNEADVVGGIYVSHDEAIDNVSISSTTHVADNTAEDNTRAFNNDYNDTHNKYANGRINPGPWTGEDGSHVFNTVDMNASGFEIVVRLQYNFEGSYTTTFEQFEFSSDDRILSSSEVWDEHIAGKEPTRLGHNFIGWSYTPEGEIIDSTQLEGEVILADLNAYAQWEPDPTYLNVSIPTAVFFQSNHVDATQLESPRYTIKNNSIMGVHVDVANFQENNATGINLIDELNIRSTPTSSTPITLITNGSIESIPTDNSRLLEIPGLTDGSFEFSGRSNVTTQFENPSFNLVLRFEVANVDGGGTPPSIIPENPGETFPDPETRTVWRVLVPDDGNGNALIITEYVHMEGIPYHSNLGFTYYRDSDIRTVVDNWFNDSTNVGSSIRSQGMSYEFQNNSGEAVARTELGAGIEVDRLPDSANSETNSFLQGTNVLRGRTRALAGTAEPFILSVSEVNAYFTDDADRETQLATNTSTNALWWLRSSSLGGDETSELHHALTSSYGSIGNGTATLVMSNRGIRPAVWVRR